MAVYVDDYCAPYRGMNMYHMIADSREELDAMVDRIGVDRRHIQRAGTYHEHYDICGTKRRLAITFGAIPLTAKALARKLVERRHV